MTTVYAVLVPLSMLGGVSGILLLRNGRDVVGRLVLLLLPLPFAVLLADTAISGDWFVAVLAALGLVGGLYSCVGISKVVSPS